MVVMSTVIMAVGMLFGDKLADPFALSNIAQLISTTLLIGAFPRLLRPRDHLWIALGLASVIIAIFSVSVQYHYNVQLAHTAYFLVCAVYLCAVYRACHDRAALPDFERGLRIAIPVALVVMIGRYSFEVAQGEQFPALGFDDKSHASVAGCFFAFASLRFLRARSRILISLAFIAVALAVPSRLTFIFLPFYLVAFLVEYRRVRRSAETPAQVYLTHLALLAASIAPVYLMLRAGEFFSTSINRVFDPNSAARSSTDNHLDLLRLGAELKLDSVANLFLGIGPGGFAGVAYHSGIDLKKYDIPLHSVKEGTAPLHSALGSIILEFPLWVAVAYIVLLIKILRGLIVRREPVLALFLCSLPLATLFYSTHNEVLFLVCTATLVAVAFGQDGKRVTAAP